MKLMHVDHIGIAVRNLDEAVRFYENVLGLSCYRIEEVRDQKVRTAFFRVGATKVELLESIGPDGPVAKFIGKKGEGLHHIAFMVQNLAQALKEIELEGVNVIDEEPRRGAEGRTIAFLHPKSTHGVLIELCEGIADQQNADSILKST
jgi:methylmalonyl-CoA/ethylmalonyl-CoA epimerase